MQAVRKTDFVQPASFEFSSENLKHAKEVIARYPAGKQQSAVMPLLTLAQRQNAGWLPRAAIAYVSEMLEMPFIRAYEVASFYTMYNLAPIGKHFVQCCTTTPCWLRGSDDVVKACKDELGIGLGETTADNQFTLVEVECLGACVNAPMVQIGDHFYEDLNYDSTRTLLQKLKKGEAPKAGPQNGRKSSEPTGGLTTLASQKKGAK